MTKRPFFFHTLGFQRNPFGALTDEEWAEIAILPPAVAAQVQQAAHLQLIGPKGCGKTSAMRGIRAHLQTGQVNMAYEYLPEGTTKFNTMLPGLDLFLLDEAQRLTRWERRRWLRGVKNGRLRTIFSSHEDLSALFVRKKLPLTTIHLAPHVTPSHYAAILQRRLAFFAFDDPPRITFSNEATVFLVKTFGQDMRAAEYFLYEVWQGIEEVGEITAVYLQHH